MEPVLRQMRSLIEHKRYDEIFALCTLLDLEQVRNATLLCVAAGRAPGRTPVLVVVSVQPPRL